MDNRERFKSIVQFKKPDYVPIFGFHGAAGVSRSYWTSVRYPLVKTGMPTQVGSVIRGGRNCEDMESWHRYWGTTTPLRCDLTLGHGVAGFKEERRLEGEFEIIESESGAVTRQVINNSNTYSMPEFVSYPIRDRESWEFYRERMSPAKIMPLADFEQACKAYDSRKSPLNINVEGVYHFLRGNMGTERLSLSFYDDPDLIHDMAAWHLEQARRHIFPLIERLKPEIVTMNEDLCYKNGMLLSPALFHEYAGPQYQAVCNLARTCGADLVAVDTDGNAMAFVPIAAAYGVNGMFPFEVHAGNDLFALREHYPRFVLFGWLEKEVINEGNETRIETEIMSKVPRLLQAGGYFPNADHSLQPLLTFKSLCKFMTILHDICGNPEGDFPRMH